MEIENNRAHLRIDRFPAEYDSYAIPPGGWLVAVTAQFDRQRADYSIPDDMERNKPIHIEITDTNGAALHGGFDIDWHIGYDQGGIVFLEPLPNVSTAHPYILQVKSAHPHLLVYSLNCWHVR
jgi:hypothetical protein